MSGFFRSWMTCPFIKIVHFFSVFLIAAFLLSAHLASAGTYGPVTISDETPTVPLAQPTPVAYAPRYLSGFGVDDTFTVFFEDRDDSSRIKYLSTTTGPTGFPAIATSTNITDTHVLVKDWPITIASTPYQYRAWGAVGNVPEHNFYVSNDLTSWTLVNTFTIPNAAGFTGRGFAYYGFYDVMLINGTYYAFSETNGGQTVIVRSANGDDAWEAFASVGGTQATDGPLQTPESGTPSGGFVELSADSGYGLIRPRGNDSGFYLAVNTAAKGSLSPAQLEAAFVNPLNWTWHDGRTGIPGTPLLAATVEHDLREVWVVPRSDPNDDWTLIYTADYGAGDGGKALGYAVEINPPVRYAASGIPPYTYDTAVQSAYDASSDSYLIELQAVTFTGDLFFDLNKSVSLIGGYDPDYIDNTSYTIINGIFTISDGAVVLENIIIR